MQQNLTLRLARPEDLGAVDALFARSYPRLLTRDYPPSIMVTLVPILARAKPGLLASGRYFLVEDGEGRVLGAGGYSLAKPGRAEIRHLATDPGALRQGIGRRLMQAVFAAAGAEGVAGYDCLATLTAVPFYAAQGFVAQGLVEVPMRPALSFRAMRMVRQG